MKFGGHKLSVYCTIFYSSTLNMLAIVLRLDISCSQEGCHSSGHHILTQQPPKWEGREGSKGAFSCGLLLH